MHIEIVFDAVCPWCYIGKPSRRPEGTGKATRRAAVRGPRGDKGGAPPAYGMRGTPPRPPASSRAACDAPASRRDALLTGNLATPSYVYNLADTGH